MARHRPPDPRCAQAPRPLPPAAPPTYRGVPWSGGADVHPLRYPSRSCSSICLAISTGAANLHWAMGSADVASPGGGHQSSWSVL